MTGRIPDRTSMPTLMHRLLLLARGTALAAAAAFLLAGCTIQQRAARHFRRAEAYRQAGDYAKAEIEYINVLRRVPEHAGAIGGLGLIYFDQGRISRMYAYLHKAEGLQPGNLAVRTRLARLYINAGRWREGRAEALYVLERQPADPDAPILLAQSSVQRAEIDAARTQLRQLPDALRGSAPVLAAEGFLELRTGRTAAALEAFRRAEAADPKSAVARLGTAYVRLALKDSAGAEQAFAAAARLAPPRSPIRVQHAQYAVQLGHSAAVKPLLEQTVKEAPDCLPPRIVLAGIVAAEKKHEAALELLQPVLAADESNPEAVMLRARICLAVGQPAKAIPDLERALQSYASSPPLRLQLGAQCVAAGDLPRAAASLQEALKLQPDFPAASLGLADVHLRQGSAKAAVGVLERLVQQHPELAGARYALANAQGRAGDWDAALATYRSAEQAAPKDAALQLAIGRTLVRLNRPADAAAAFDRALALQPGSYPALEERVMLEVRQRRPDEAIRLAKAEIERDNRSAGAHLLLARLERAARHPIEAEQWARRAIELSPDSAAGYLLLGQLHADGSQADDAAASFAAAAQRSPSDPEPVMLLAAIRHQQGRLAEARDAYEKVLKLNPRFAPALNNLACLYADAFPDLDRAFELAQRSRALQPDDGHAADTLGWVLFQRREHAWALSLLSEAAEKLPRSPEVLAHFGLASYMLGSEPEARTALAQALQSGEAFPARPRAEKALALLNTDFTAADAGRIAAAEKAASADGDPVAWLRVADWRANHGDQAGAVAACRAATLASPGSVPAALALVRCLRGAGKTDEAIEQARLARKLAPANADIAQELAAAAFDAGEPGWAASLYAEVQAQRPDDPELACALARAAWHAGQVGLAREQLERACRGERAFAGAAEARVFLELIGAASAPEGTDAEAARLAALVAARPNDAAALLALAACQARRGERAAAIASSRSVLAGRPRLPQAQRQLAILLSDDAANDRTVIELAGAARKAFPADAPLAKALGIALVRQGQNSRAVPILDSIARVDAPDAEVLFYLGTAQNQLRQRAAGAKLLEQALTLGLRPDLAARARAILAQKS